MSDLVGNPEDRFSHVAAHIIDEALEMLEHDQKEFEEENVFRQVCNNF